MSTAPLREALAEALPERPFRVDALGRRRSCRRRPATGPVFSVRSPVALGHMLRAPGQLGPRPRLRGRRARRRRHRQGARAARRLLARRRSTRARRRGWPPPPSRAGALQAAAAHARRRAAPAGPAPLDRARQARGHAPLRRLERLLRALPRRVDDLLVRDLVARRGDARGGAGDQARARLHEARRCSAGERVLDVGCGWGSFARPRRAATTACTSPASRCPSRRPRARAGAPQEAGVGRPRRHPRDGLPRAARRARSTRSPRSAWSSTSASVNIDAYARDARRAARARRPAAQPRHRAAAPRRAGGRARSRSATCSPTPRRCTSRASQRALERAGFETLARRGLPRTTTRARCASGRARLEDNHAEARAAGRPRAHARVAGLPARRAARLRDRLHVGLPGAGRQGLVLSRRLAGATLRIHSRSTSSATRA